MIYQAAVRAVNPVTGAYNEKIVKILTSYFAMFEVLPGDFLRRQIEPYIVVQLDHFFERRVRGGLHAADDGLISEINTILTDNRAISDFQIIHEKRSNSEEVVIHYTNTPSNEVFTIHCSGRLRTLGERDAATDRALALLQ